MSNFFHKGGVINTAQYSVVQYIAVAEREVFDPQSNAMKKMKVVEVVVDIDKTPNFDGIQIFMAGVQGQAQIIYMYGNDMHRYLEVLRQENEA